MRVLVLGSSGVIGTSLVKKLLNNDHEVVEWDIAISTDHDLRDPSVIPLLEKTIQTCDFVYFLAYDVGGSKYLNNLDVSYINDNVNIMKNTFSCLRNVPFVFASSQMYNMENVYGVLKHLGEYYTKLLGGLSLRFWNVYGKEDVSVKSHVIPDMIDKFKTTGSVTLLTNGLEERQFLYTDDCAECLLVIMNNFAEICQSETSVDVTSFTWHSILDVAQMISDNVVVGEKGETVQTCKNEPRDFILRYWKPKTSLEDGIASLIYG